MLDEAIASSGEVGFLRVSESRLKSRRLEFVRNSVIRVASARSHVV